MGKGFHESPLLIRNFFRESYATLIFLTPPEPLAVAHCAASGFGVARFFQASTLIFSNSGGRLAVFGGFAF
jgi:hypothetical protein